MKNLTILSQKITTIETIESSKVQARKIWQTLDPETGDLYFLRYSELSEQFEVVKCHSIETSFPEVEVIASITNEHDISILGLNDIICGIKYLMDIQAICIAFSNGDIILVHLDNSLRSGDLIEVVGSVESNIKCMEWSPDEEIIILVTGMNTILEMTKDFDVITEYPINVDEAGEAAGISLGWGRKETQFHGSEGKSSAQKKVDTSGFTLSDYDDDLKPRVSWCGDGNMFCCSIIDQNKGLRIIRVYNREGILQNTSEPIDKLEHTLAWRPIGNLIASSQRFSNKHNIIFFEKNGLRHGEFSLREKSNHKIIEISWNCDSIQLWNMNNFHWYLKQEILCSPEEHITENYHRIDFVWDIFYSNFISEKNMSPIAVIDGATIKLTPFKIMNVPPPMSAFSVGLTNNATFISFLSSNDGSNDFLVLQADQNISINFYEWSGALETPLKPPTLLGTISIPDINNGALLRQVTWVNKNVLLCLRYNQETGNDDLIKIIVKFNNEEENKQFIVSSYKSYSLSYRVIRLYSNSNYENIFIESCDASVYQVVCNWICSTKIGAEKRDEVVLIGLSGSNKLCVNNEIIEAYCTSIFIHNDFLIFTNSNHIVRFLPLQMNLSDFKNSAKEFHEYNHDMRRIERGSKIICAVYFDVNLVLQMPRGNLETIHPRALVLSSVKEFLNRFDYLSAFIACRKHRIDLNILYDHAPNLFLKNVQSFVTQIANVDFLNLFLSNLRNEDVIQTMYRTITNNSNINDELESNSAQQNVTSKVNNICDAVRAVLETLDSKKYLQSIITTYVRHTPPDLEPALNLIAKIKDQDMNLSEEAIKFTIFLIDADRLFDVALGMYDFNLVIMVAQHSQRDPREYLTFLAELEKYPKYYQRFKIDHHLKRYEKALDNLSLAGDEYFDELLKYTQQYNLYNFAVKLFSNNNDNKEKYKRVMRIYGEYLFNESDFKEAGLAYLLSDDKVNALEAYKKCGFWRESFSIAYELKYSENELFSLAKEFSEILSEKRRYQEAAQILLDYAKQTEEAILLFNKGHHWSEAMRISHMYNRIDLIETDIKPSVIEGFNNLLQDVNSMLDQLNHQTARLKEIRITKLNQSVDQFYGEEVLEVSDNVDVLSDTSSMVSGFSRYTQSITQLSVNTNKSGKSAKSRRRAERKRARGKKGSIYEEEYLIDSLKRLIERFNNTQ
ncbi:10141_t:CDS:10, partial [Entrophospora sp. SA101]